MMQLEKPLHLQRNDMIGIVSPSASLAGLVPHRVKNGLAMLKTLGFRTKIGKHALKITSYTAGNPEQRAEDINSFFKDDAVKAIFTFIGGNHSNQILQYLDFDLIQRNPKIFLGYSDSTVLHLALYTKAHLVSFYGPAVLTQFAETPKMFSYTQEYFAKALMSTTPIGVVKPAENWTDDILDWFTKQDLKQSRIMKKSRDWQWIKGGKAIGPILGGCITSMMHLRGTSYWPDFSDAILFWEIPESNGDITQGENPETVDAYLTDLELSGIFSMIKGMIIGRPFAYNQSQRKNLIRLIKVRTKTYNFPILFDVDFGHTDPMVTIPYGVRVELDSRKNLFKFLESGVQ